MSTAELLEQLKQLTDVERLEVIEVATRLIRQGLAPDTADVATERDRRLRAAAAGVKEMYEPGSELTEWTALDAEEFADEHLAR
jgi:hypothetical protein